jgi:tRNA A37 methylthiotransferase MiaB
VIHLIRSPYKTDSICPPINLLALAAYVEPHHAVSMTDLVVPYVRGELTLDAAGLRRAATRLLENPAPVLGFTAMCSSFAAAVRLAEECKRQDPDRFILFGGPHVSFVATEALKAFSSIDAVVVGEGEQALKELMDARRDGRPFHDVHSLVFRDGDNIVQTARSPVVDDLDSLPVPAFHLVGNIDDYYGNELERFIEIEAGRGCPFNCNFCSTSLFFARKYRVKSPQRLLAEMSWLSKNWGIQSFGLIHDNLTSNRVKVRELCNHLLDSGERFHWFCSSRTDTIDRPLMELMQRAGCRGIFFGVETGSQPMQRTVGKRLKLNKARETFSHLLEVGMSGTASFIIGFPEEPPEALEETLSMALELRMVGVRDVQIHPLSALPGTQVLDEREEQLVFHPHLLDFQDITSVIDITDVELQWISQHKRLFSNFYAVQPLHYPLDLVYQVRGCYFYLIHFRPHTLSALHTVAGLPHLEIVRRLTSRLPPAYQEWKNPELLRALDEIIAELPEELGRFISDVNAYEQAMLSTAEFTSGDNGWVRYKGALPSAVEDANGGPMLKPCQSLKLEYDIPEALRAMKGGEPAQPSRRDLHVAIVFDLEGQRLRTLEVDALTALIIEQVREGTALGQVLLQLSHDNPHLSQDTERERWIGQVLEHLGKARLIAEPVAA